MTSQATPTRIIRFGVFEVDLEGGEVRRAGMRQKLGPQPFQVLRAMLERPGEIVTRDELRKRLWPAETFVDYELALKKCLSRIRQVLGDSADNPRFIETVPRRGYRFIAAVEPESARNNGARPIAAEQYSSPPATPVGKDDSPSVYAQHGIAPVEQVGGRKPKVTSRVLGWFVVAGLLAIALLAIGYFVTRSRSENVTPPRIGALAVLPLKNLSGDPAQEYLADGMTDALIGRLSQIRGLRVVSHTSVMRFKKPQISVPEIASNLHVDAIVEGSVMREGNRIRVTAQLIRGATDEHFWSETYDRELGDALALESSLAQTVAEKVEVTVTGEEHERLTAARPVAPEVYENYLRGSYGLNKFLETYKRADLETSIAYFQNAVKEDATFAPAYVKLAAAYSEFGTNFIGDPPDPALEKEMDAAQKAVQLDPNLADAHILLGEALAAHWQWAEAEAQYRRALQLSPNNPDAHSQLAWWLLCHGRTDEALAWDRRARELDPLVVGDVDVGRMLFESRRYDESERELRSALAGQPNNAVALWDLGILLIDKNQGEAAIPVLEKAVSASSRSPGVISTLARAYAQAGRREDALQLLDELKARRKAGFIPAWALANAYIGLGDKDQAFAWLEQGYKEHSNILRLLKVDPAFDPVRGDPRFADLLRHVGLE